MGPGILWAIAPNFAANASPVPEIWDIDRPKPAQDHTGHGDRRWEAVTLERPPNALRIWHTVPR